MWYSGVQLRPLLNICCPAASPLPYTLISPLIAFWYSHLFPFVYMILEVTPETLSYWSETRAFSNSTEQFLMFWSQPHNRKWPHFLSSLRLLHASTVSYGFDGYVCPLSPYLLFIMSKEKNKKHSHLPVQPSLLHESAIILWSLHSTPLPQTLEKCCLKKKPWDSGAPIPITLS